MKIYAKNNIYKLGSLFCILLVFGLFMLFMPFTDTISYADPLEPEDYANEFDVKKFNPSWKYISKNIELWTDAEQSDRIEYYLYKTNKEPVKQNVSSVKAYHTKGNETTLSVGVSYLTQEETIKTFGSEASVKFGVVVAKLDIKWKWGTATSKSIDLAGTFKLSSEMSSGYYQVYATANIQEYYLLVRKVHRIVNKDKKGNITYGTYTFTIDNTQSGYFENFDMDSVKYKQREVEQ